MLWRGRWLARMPLFDRLSDGVLGGDTDFPPKLDQVRGPNLELGRI
jgi:hypothetical protein